MLAEVEAWMDIAGLREIEPQIPRFGEVVAHTPSSLPLFFSLISYGLNKYPPSEIYSIP
jgi:hypothetical protein